MNPNDAIDNQSGRLVKDSTPLVISASQRKSDLASEIFRLKEQYSALRFNDPSKAELKSRLNALRCEFSSLKVDKPQKPSDESLSAAYDTPDSVPADVRQWIKQNASLLSSDASDAVRWGRISDTLADSRHPSGSLTIYRAVADGVDIRAGDWVTTEREYAQMHLSRYLSDRGEILEASVDGRDVLKSPTGNSEEAIYAPRNLSGPLESEFPAPEADANAKKSPLRNSLFNNPLQEQQEETLCPLARVECRGWPTSES